MKRTLISLLTIVCICGCKKNNEQFENINSRLDNLENTTIASINQQIASINTSIGNLEETDAELRGYITNLQNTATDLQNSINTTNDKIDRVERELKADLASTKDNLSAEILAAKTELLNNLISLRTEMQGKLDQINIAIGNLQSADVNLGIRIDQLRSYTDAAIGNTKDWASTTFSTLEQYNQTVTEIAGIKANITAINTAMSELETRINNKIAADIAQAVSTLEGELQQQAADITQAYQDAIATAKGEIESAYTQAIQTAISNSESSMQSWVNDKLTGYYTIAQTDAKLATLRQTLESDLATQKQYLEGKISILETSLTAKIEANGTLIAGLQSQINSLSGDLSRLAETVATNSQNISQNATNIATNAQNIATNASDIDECERLIAENNRLIQANTTAIGENASAITALQSRLTTDEQNIATNASNISKNASDIAANAELIATNAEAISNNAIAISTNATNIAHLQSSLATAITDITTAYTTAISSAITENNGVINAKIAADIATAQAALQQQIDAIITRINNLESRVGSLEETVADILNTVQDIVVIPTYSDGSVAYTSGDNDFFFEVLPSGAASRLAAADKDCFTMKAVYTQTKTVPSFVFMLISSVKAEGDILIITASGASLNPSEGQSASASLTITSGAVSKSTGYFPLFFTPSVIDAVDLGLSVKWASWNLGASKAEDYGDYYAWGETETREDYRWETYKYGGPTSLTKYNYSASNGIVDNKTQLEQADDIARQTLGAAWRIPTAIEWDELANKNNCSWIWTEFNGVYGYKVFSKKAGYTDKWIFLPAAGQWDGTSVKDVGDKGNYLSSSLCMEYPYDELCARFTSSAVASSNAHYRYCGLSVRPVSGDDGLSIILDHSSLVLFEGESLGLIATINHPFTSSAPTVSWSSSNNSIVTVTNDGFVSGIHEGSAKVTATCGGKSTSCEITVTNGILDTDYVDFGLSVKWASRNLGEEALVDATYDYGSYYAWGETNIKSEYSWTTYGYGNSPTSLTKYNTNPSNGAVDYKNELEISDDVARQKLGNSWRMPTIAEWTELKENCTWNWTTLKGVLGYKVMGKKVGFENKWIFLPAGGRWEGASVNSIGENGYYWSSSHSQWASLPSGASALHIFDGVISTESSGYPRYLGQSVRPVWDEKEYIPLGSLSISQPSLSLIKGESAQLSATINPSNASTKMLSWISSNQSVAVVTSSGKVIASKAGTTNITVCCGGRHADCIVTVTE